MDIARMKTPKLRETLAATEADTALHDELASELRRRSLGTPRRKGTDKLYKGDARRMHRQARTSTPFKTWWRAQAFKGPVTPALGRIAGRELARALLNTGRG